MKACHQGLPDVPDDRLDGQRLVGHRDDLRLSACRQDDLRLGGHRDDPRLLGALQGDQEDVRQDGLDLLDARQDGLGQLDARLVVLVCRLADLHLEAGHLGDQGDAHQGVSAGQLDDLPQRGARLDVQGDVRQWLACH